MHILFVIKLIPIKIEINFIYNLYQIIQGSILENINELVKLKYILLIAKLS